MIDNADNAFNQRYLYKPCHFLISPGYSNVISLLPRSWPSTMSKFKLTIVYTPVFGPSDRAMDIEIFLTGGIRGPYQKNTLGHVPSNFSVHKHSLNWVSSNYSKCSLMDDMGCEYNGSRMMVLWHLDRFQLNFIVTVRSSSDIIQFASIKGYILQLQYCQYVVIVPLPLI